MARKNRKSTVKKAAIDGRRFCPFCKKAGLLDHELPLTDEERETLTEKKTEASITNDQSLRDALQADPLLKRPLVYEFEFEKQFGGWLQDDDTDGTDNFSCHQQCLLGSPTLFHATDPDNEYFIDEDAKDDTLGGYGFHRKAIAKEIKRAEKLKCAFCKKGGANIGCNITKCTKKYHYPCAVNANYIMVSDNKTNPSFCVKHMTREHRYDVSKGFITTGPYSVIKTLLGQPKYCIDVRYDVKNGEVKLSDVQEYIRKNKKVQCQDYPYLMKVEQFMTKIKSVSAKAADKITEELSGDDASEVSCQICLDTFDDLTNIVLGRCCKYSNFHRTCLTRLGLNSGLLNYKCPLCGDTNREVFLKNSVAQGVYCPNRDASWEITNEFDDQLAINRIKNCTMETCKHPKEPSDDGTIKEIILCDSCGANGSHIDCDESLLKRFEYEEKTKQRDESLWDWLCPECGSCLDQDENSVGFESNKDIIAAAPVSNETLTMHREPEELLHDDTDDRQPSQTLNDDTGDSQPIETINDDTDGFHPIKILTDDNQPIISLNESLTAVDITEQCSNSSVSETGDDLPCTHNSDSENHDIANMSNSIDLTGEDDVGMAVPFTERQNNKPTMIPATQSRKRKPSSQDVDDVTNSPKKSRKSLTGGKRPMKQSNLITNYFNKSPGKSKL